MVTIKKKKFVIEVYIIYVMVQIRHQQIVILFFYINDLLYIIFSIFIYLFIVSFDKLSYYFEKHFISHYFNDQIFLLSFFNNLKLGVV